MTNQRILMCGNNDDKNSAARLSSHLRKVPERAFQWPVLPSERIPLDELYAHGTSPYRRQVFGITWSIYKKTGLKFLCFEQKIHPASVGWTCLIRLLCSIESPCISQVNCSDVICNASAPVRGHWNLLSLASIRL